MNTNFRQQRKRTKTSKITLLLLFVAFCMARRRMVWSLRMKSITKSKEQQVFFTCSTGNKRTKRVVLPLIFCFWSKFWRLFCSNTLMTMNPTFKMGEMGVIGIKWLRKTLSECSKNDKQQQQCHVCTDSRLSHGISSKWTHSHVHFFNSLCNFKTEREWTTSLLQLRCSSTFLEMELPTGILLKLWVR